MTLKSTTAAVIVTFNRSAKLMKVIEALQNQTVRPDVIYVVDNASTDDTAERVGAMTDPSIRHVRLPENIGGAGGFHAGMKIAYEQGANYLWISDDDAYPEPDALQKLIDALTGFEASYGWRPSFACSNVKWIDGSHCEMNTPGTVWDWPRFYTAETPWTLVRSCSFVSALIPRWAVAEHGLPIKDYFIWYDDAEYTQRIARSYPGIFVPDSLVIHDTPDNAGVNYGLITEKNIWKFRYGARNETSFRRREQGWPGVAQFAWQVYRQMRDGQVTKPLRRQIWKAVWQGTTFQPQIERV
ncbi:glycosyltransferase family 2 protein [Falsirhodobacter algicola]|uniref:Glycosyltransferase n=1 Tax=Falsirhodobacter algicola TaxID=2692330 RepID=A0A8J8MSX1_9RHOB|nr:glycosyltransferase family 2 protein [Falsirhodobacter algicola]QUS36092.1 glycosyltransferase [Falsirhodobacter algicola]